MKKVRIPRILKNFYVVVGLFFLAWILFFDSNDLFTQNRLSNKKDELEREKEFYEDQILEIRNDHEALKSDNEQLEKIAREKYLMKKDSEDVYLIVREKKD